MSVTTIPARPHPAPADRGVRARRWTRAEYHRAVELGLFRPDEQLELLNGEIIEKVSPHNPPHAAAVARAGRILGQAFGPGCHTRSQLPLIVNSRTEPEPDGVVAAGTEFDYQADHPRGVEARLVVEVSDTTLRFDRERKRPTYARAGVQEYWILNLPERQLEVYREPSGSRYRRERIYREDEAVTPLAAPDAVIRVSDLLPLMAAETG